ncbi:peptidylprolyl isomerase [Allopusillimonas ginsengisoli]|uniref:peptidylprolyl isomerase n=1 Tax=Allopusillimonas ginsengisoli TaxID=453575 RepID=UPI0039C0815D
MDSTSVSRPSTPPATELRVNGVLIDDSSIASEITAHADETDPDQAARRALMTKELFRQQACAKGLIDQNQDIDDDTIDQLTEQECRTPEPTEEECRRYYEANAKKFRSPDLVHASHILFALTEGVSMPLLRTRAEEVRRDLTRHPGTFGEQARALSNCPSGKVGGNLGQLSRGECVPEFDKALFESTETGLLPGLIKTRHGFHIVLVERRVAGVAMPYEMVSNTIARYLQEYVRHKALQQYLTLLTSSAELQGVTVDVRPGLLLQ